MADLKMPTPDSDSNMRLEVYLNYPNHKPFEARKIAREAIRRLNKSIAEFIKKESEPHKYHKFQKQTISRELSERVIKCFLWEATAGENEKTEPGKVKRKTHFRNELIQYLLHGNGTSMSKEQQFMTLPQAAEVAHQWLIILHIEAKGKATKDAIRKSYQRHIPGQLYGFPKSVYQGFKKDKNGEASMSFNYDKDFLESCKWPLKNDYFKKQTNEEILEIN